MVSVPSNGSAGGISHAATLSVAVPSGAAAGDVLLILASSSETGIPTITVNGSGTGVNTVRTDSDTYSERVAWKRLVAADLGKNVTMTNTGTERQALGLLAVRGGGDPTFVSGTHTRGSSGVTTKVGPSFTPTGSNATVFGLWANASNAAPYDGHTFSSTWTEIREIDGTYNPYICPYILLTTTTLGSGTGGVTQTGETVTDALGNWEAYPTYALFYGSIAPVVNAGPDQNGVPLGSAVTLTGTASDADGSIVSQRWTCTSFPVGSTTPTITNATTLVASFTPSVAGTYVFQLAATDNSGNVSTDSVTISSVGGPTFHGTVTAPKALIDATASTTVGSGTLSYAISPSATQITTGKFLVGQTSSPQNFTVTITDSLSGLTASGSVTVPAILSTPSNGQTVEIVEFKAGAWQ